MEKETFTRAKKLVDNIEKAKQIKEIIRARYYHMQNALTSNDISDFVSAIVQTGCAGIFDRFVKILDEDMNKSISVWEAELKEL